MNTKKEMQPMDAVIGIHREMRKANEVDWEQRRYEIAKELFPTVVAQSPARSPAQGGGQVANITVFLADLLIERLKKTEP